MLEPAFLTLVKKYQDEYDWEDLKKFPEFCIDKLINGLDNNNYQRIDESSLEDLPENHNERTRNQIIEWMKNNLDYERLEYIGW